MSLSETLSTCLGIGKDETVLLLSDGDMGEVKDIIREAVTPLTKELITITMAPRRVHGAELPRSVEEAMKVSDVVIGATSKSMTHTIATKKAVENGARVASMPGITVDMLTSGGMTADYNMVSKNAESLAALMSNGKRIEIKTDAGTDFTASIQGHQGYADTGILKNEGDFGNLPGGEGFIAPIEGSSKGKIVFDGPIASAGLSHDPIVVEIDRGVAVSTNYEPLETVFKKILNASCVAEVGVGVNPCARLIGNILEDEKVLGTAHIAFGNNINFGGGIDAEIHLDGIIKEPTIYIDDTIICENGLNCF